MCGFESHGGHLAMVAGGVIGNISVFETEESRFEAGPASQKERRNEFAGVVEWFKTAACKAAAPCAHRGLESRLRLLKLNRLGRAAVCAFS